MDSHPVREELSKTWSEVSKYIVYYFVSGEDEATHYGALNKNPWEKTKEEKDNIIAEFSDHKLIGFLDDPDKVNSIPLETGKKIVVRELPDGLINLNRFEVKHMFGYDPNIVACKNFVKGQRIQKTAFEDSDTEDDGGLGSCEDCGKLKTHCNGVYYSDDAFRQNRACGFFQII